MNFIDKEKGFTFSLRKIYQICILILGISSLDSDWKIFHEHVHVYI